MSRKVSNQSDTATNVLPGRLARRDNPVRRPILQLGGRIKAVIENIRSYKKRNFF